MRAMQGAGELDLPMPGSGSTRARFHALARMSRGNTVLGRMAEAHCDALAIVNELNCPGNRAGALWGVWAAEPPTPVVQATPHGDSWQLSGRKRWCSGASMCDAALVTARLPDERRALFAVDLVQPGVVPVPDTWHAVGMADSDSGSVDFDSVAATLVGEPGGYLTRPGFWHGAIGVAACWYGSACGVADTLHQHVRDGKGDEHTAAHLGAVASRLRSASAVLDHAAQEIDTDPFDERGGAHVRALAVRATVESVATEVMDRVGRALGAGPLCENADHARRVADLTVYLRQSHAERDLAALGRAVGECETPW